MRSRVFEKTLSSPFWKGYNHQNWTVGSVRDTNSIQTYFKDNDDFKDTDNNYIKRNLRDTDDVTIVKSRNFDNINYWLVP